MPLVIFWNGADAELQITGELISLQRAAQATPLNYLVFSRNQCASCHATEHTSGAMQPIGIKARHLNRHGPKQTQNQLSQWYQAGWLLGVPQDLARNAPANAMFAKLDDQHQPHTLSASTLNHYARSYLDINCGHCHNAVGAADTSGLWLDYATPNEFEYHHNLYARRTLDICKMPIAAGRGTGGRLYTIVPSKPANLY